MIRKALEAASVEADLHVVRDGDAATRFFDAVAASEGERCPNLVLLDLNLPKRSGEEVLRHLRASTKCGQSPVVIVTSAEAASDAEPAKTFGVAAYFRKPSQFAEFMKLGTIVKTLLRGDAA